MSSSSAPASTAEGPGSASGAPNLPAGFTDTFMLRSRATCRSPDRDKLDPEQIDQLGPPRVDGADLRTRRVK